MTKLQERCVFNISEVQERAIVAAAYKARGQAVRFSRTFMIVSEKGSELLDHSLRRVRARLVVGGDDVRDADNEPVFYCDYANAPTTCTATRVCIAYGNSPGCSCFVLDADAAYLQALLAGDDTYVSLPRWLWPKSWRGFKSPVVLLKRALYGHPLAGQSWYDHMAACLRRLGFTAVEGWDSVFVRGSILLIIYVDDFMLSGPTLLAKAAAKDVATVMSMGKAEPLSRFLACLYGVRPTFVRGSFVNVVEFDMRDYLKQCVSHYFDLVSSVEADLAILADGKSLPRSKQRNKEEACSRGFANLPSPESPDVDLSHTRRLRSLREAHTPYLDDEDRRAWPDGAFASRGTLHGKAASILMKLLYIARLARPDLLRAIIVLAADICRWSRAHDVALRRVIEYCNTTADVTMRGCVGDDLRDCVLVGHADADFASNKKTSKSTSGAWVYLKGPRTSMVLSYTCKRQGCVATSTPEAEIVSAERCIRKDLVPLSLVLTSFLKRFPAMVLGEDNNTCSLALERGASKEIRHISRSQRVSLASLAGLIRILNISLLRVDSKDMLADVFTKPFTELHRWNHALQLACLTQESDAELLLRLLGGDVASGAVRP
jgi:hypothetical protein